MRHPRVRPILSLGVLLLAGPAIVSAQGTPDTGRAPRPSQIRPPWIAPSAEEVAARRGGTQPSLRAGIVLTKEQETAMEAAREQYRPRLRDLVSRWQTAARAGKDVSVLEDSVRQVTTAQRTAVLAVLTATQRSQYDENERRVSATPAERQ